MKYGLSKITSIKSTITMILFLTILIVNFTIIPTTAFGSITRPSIESLPRQWRYQIIFPPTNVPLPPSAQNLGAQVKAIYSPSVVYYNNQYLMFFGVSIYCQNGAVARDSIALAKSIDGINWSFDKYIVEPPAITCTTARSNWPNGTVFQVNDPKAHLAGSQIFLFYTTVFWPNDNYGHIGISHINSDLVITHRDDKYLAGNNILNSAGFSRPDIRYTVNPPELWVDSAGKIGSIPITSYYKLDGSKIKNEQISGHDINLPKLSNTQDLILYNGSTILARHRNLNSTWQAPYTITQKTGQGWDTWYQGSPDLFLDPNSCKLRLYFSGAVEDGTGWYSRISIGVATPIDDTQFYYDACPLPINNILPGDFNSDGVVDIKDYNLLVANFGNPYTIFDYNILVENYNK